MAALPEVIVICIDASCWMPEDSPNFNRQLEAIEYYCRAKFNENPDTVIGLFAMGDVYPCLFLNPPTGSLTQILDRLKDLTPGSGDLNFCHSLSYGRIPFTPSIDDPNKIKRSLLFVGGLTNLSGELAEAYGESFRDRGVAVDVVNFCLDETTDDVVFGSPEYGRAELVAFFNLCNRDNNSHMVDVLPESDICQLISEHILKETAKNAEAAADDEARVILPPPKKMKLV